MSSFEAISNLHGKVAVIIGGNGAVGFATAKRLSKLGALCILIGRNAIEKGRDQLPLLFGKGHTCIDASITDSSTLKKFSSNLAVAIY